MVGENGPPLDGWTLTVHRAAPCMTRTEPEREPDVWLGEN